ncbi:MAG: addiction module toxin RelE [Desulfatiglans sp.]|mgnify:CR=1 FL=1|jgi:phage-related protein|nr:addiction module toxin RelE [Desulfatiglans sp.]
MKELIWMGSSKNDLIKFPDDVRRVMGYALYLAQKGDKYLHAKPLKGFKGAGVLEIVEDFEGDTYRAVYTVQFKDIIFVLHAFQKKSKKGISTPKMEMDIINSRLKRAKEIYIKGEYHG